MALSDWTPPPFAQRPSEDHRGESDKTPLFEAVGRALSDWEYGEMAMAWLFGLLVESDSDAAVKAYGTIYGGPGRKDAFSFAVAEFFTRHPDRVSDRHDMEKLLAAYEMAWSYRNNIAHGIVMAIIDTHAAPAGWFLQSPEYASKKRDPHNTFYSRYYYNVPDIENAIKRFREIQQEAERLSHLRQ
jgi:hypothetical protein